MSVLGSRLLGSRRGLLAVGSLPAREDGGGGDDRSHRPFLHRQSSFALNLHARAGTFCRVRRRRRLSASFGVGCSVILGLCPRFRRTRAGAGPWFSSFNGPRRPSPFVVVSSRRAPAAPCWLGALADAHTLESGACPVCGFCPAVTRTQWVRPARVSTSGPRGVFLGYVRCTA